MSTFQENSTHGLTNRQAQNLQKLYGPNILVATKSDTIGVVFLKQFLNPLIYLLVMAAALIFLLGYHMDAFIITGVLLFNGILGTLQEQRTRSIIASLYSFIPSRTAVIRDGYIDIIDSSDLVPGDVIVMQAGEKIPADAQVFEAENLRIDESMLTGESKPISKSAQAANNQIWSGTYILSGTGKAIVTAIGKDTQLGKLHKTVETIKTDTPLKHSIDQLAHHILIAIVIICLVLFAIGLATGKPIKELIVMITALFICIIPEGLPVVVTLTLVSGAYRMAQKNVVTKNMQAIEGLGRINILMIDKTGTLTRNEMIVTTLFADNTLYTVTGQGYHRQGSILKNNHVVPQNEFNSDLVRLLQIAGLISTAHLEYDTQTDTFHVKGDPTEAALHVLAQKTQVLEHERSTFKKIAHMPFSTQLRYQAGLYQHIDQIILCVTGGPEMIVSLCSTVDAQSKDAIASFLSQGLRVIAAAYRIVQPSEFNELTMQPDDLPQLLHNLTFLGIYGIQDTIRTDVELTIRQAQKAGIKIIMATGDHQDTALYVARKVGIYKDGDLALDGAQFIDRQLTKNELEKCTVYSRVKPEQKLQLALAYRSLGAIIAMTGDGVNDTPALVAADIGIAMGKIGTEVAKESADLILLDDSLASIIEAVKEGRTIFQAIRRIICYFFTTNLAEVWLVLFSFLLQLPLPILAAQILWINLVTDGFLDAALSQEPQEHTVLSPSHTIPSSLLDTSSWINIMIMSIPMGIISVSVFSWYVPDDIQLARTMAMTTLATCQWFNAWNYRSEYYSLFEISLFSNIWLIAASLLVIAFQFSIIYIPLLQKIFGTVPLSLNNWLLILTVSIPVILIQEMRKQILKK